MRENFQLKNVITIAFQSHSKYKMKQIFFIYNLTTLCGSNVLEVLELIINCEVCG